MHRLVGASVLGLLSPSRKPLAVMSENPWVQEHDEHRKAAHKGHDRPVCSSLVVEYRTVGSIAQGGIDLTVGGDGSPPLEDHTQLIEAVIARECATSVKAVLHVVEGAGGDPA